MTLVSSTKGFDPAGFTDRIASKDDLYRYREAELKHGRICMLAVTGILVQEIYTWPAPDGVFEAPTPLGALSTVPPFGLLQIVLVIGIIEATSSGYQGRVPGDLGFDPLGLSADGIKPWYAKVRSHSACVGARGRVIHAPPRLPPCRRRSSSTRAWPCGRSPRLSSSPPSPVSPS